jgi:hypothetical protein
LFCVPKHAGRNPWPRACGSGGAARGQGFQSRHHAAPGADIAERPGDFSHLDDPAFLDERARVRKRLEHVPENTIGRRELERVYQAMTVEFCRRARIAWTEPS